MKIEIFKHTAGHAKWDADQANRVVQEYVDKEFKVGYCWIDGDNFPEALSEEQIIGHDTHRIIYKTEPLEVEKVDCEACSLLLVLKERGCHLNIHQEKQSINFCIECGKKLS